MCAINGILGPASDRINILINATAHRGPDGTGVYVKNNIGLGHNRLAIIDLSTNAAQPMSSGDGRYTIVFNGEIYNFQELKTQLKDEFLFTTQSDTEVLLVAYQKWGTDCLNKLRGIFAFAIWDEQDKILFASRDQFGVKPLYYSFDGTNLVFSSELQALSAFFSENSINKNALNTYLGMHYVPSPDSLIQGIQKLPSGHTLIYKTESKSLVIKQYYKSETSVSDNKNSYTDVYDVIDTAVQRQLVSDRPIGLFLSGGLDSSILLHHISKHTDSLNTYSTAFEMISGAENEADKFNSDANIAKQTSEMYGTNHTTFTISIEDVRNNIEHILANIDEPVANPTTLSRFFLSKYSREAGAVVAYGGDGGDELFAGYLRHKIIFYTSIVQKFPKLFQNISQTLKPNTAKLFRGLPVEAHTTLMSLPNDQVNGVLNSYTYDQSQISTFFESVYKNISYIRNPLERFLVADRMTWLPDESLMNTDKMSMMVGQEVRVPFLDFDLVHFANSLKRSQKISIFSQKVILRQRYKGLLPEHIFDQPKRGWISPGAKWLRDPVINKWALEVLSPNYYDGLGTAIDWDTARQLLLDHSNHRTYALNPLWNIITLQVWARKNSVKF